MGRASLETHLQHLVSNLVYLAGYAHTRQAWKLVSMAVQSELGEFDEQSGSSGR
jgi:hypothetical protein